jgi:hypothetical protein
MEEDCHEETEKGKKNNMKKGMKKGKEYWRRDGEEVKHGRRLEGGNGEGQKK